MEFVDEWVTVRERDGKWDVRLKEGEDSYLLVFIDLPRRDMAEGFADRIKESLKEYASEFIDYCGL